MQNRRPALTDPRRWDALADSLATDHRLDPLLDPLGAWAEKIAPAGRTRALLRGATYGHPLHPMLTDVAIGCWTSAMALDLLGPRRSSRAAQRLVGLGVLAAAPAALTGWAEWADADLESQRVGVVHAGANATAVALYALSWRARRRHQHVRGVALGLVGGAVASAGGYLGGHLAFRRGVGQTTRSMDTVDGPGALDPSERGSAPGSPGDNTTLSEVVAGYEAAGFTTPFRVGEGGTITCRHCDTPSPANRFTLHSLRRLEGASDPDDMMSVAAVGCPACGAKGLLVLPYGPEASEDESLVYLALDDRRGDGLPSSAAPGEQRRSW